MQSDATAVPDLQAMNKPADPDYWTRFITEGKPDSMMPAFAQDQGGFLTPAQTASLVSYLIGDFRRETGIVYRDPHAVPPPSPAVTIKHPMPPGAFPRPGVPGTNLPPASLPKPTALLAPGVGGPPANTVK